MNSAESRWKIAGRFFFNVAVAPLLIGLAIIVVAKIVVGLGLIG